MAPLAPAQPQQHEQEEAREPARAPGGRRVHEDDKHGTATADSVIQKMSVFKEPDPRSELPGRGAQDVAALAQRGELGPLVLPGEDYSEPPVAAAASTVLQLGRQPLAALPPVHSPKGPRRRHGPLGRRLVRRRARLGVLIVVVADVGGVFPPEPVGV